MHESWSCGKCQWIHAGYEKGCSRCGLIKGDALNAKPNTAQGVWGQPKAIPWNTWTDKRFCMIFAQLGDQDSFCTGGPSHLAFPPPHGPPPAADIMKATASHLRSSQVCLSAATSCQEPRRRLRAKSSNRHAHSLAGLPRTRGPRGLQLRTRVTQRSSGNLATYCANV